MENGIAQSMPFLYEARHTNSRQAQDFADRGHVIHKDVNCRTLSALEALIRKHKTTSQLETALAMGVPRHYPHPALAPWPKWIRTDQPVKQVTVRVELCVSSAFSHRDALLGCRFW